MIILKEDVPKVFKRLINKKAIVLDIGHGYKKEL